MGSNCFLFFVNCKWGQIMCMYDVNYVYTMYNIAAHRGRSGVCDIKIYLCISCGLRFLFVSAMESTMSFSMRWFCFSVAPSTPQLFHHFAEASRLHYRWWLVLCILCFSAPTGTDFFCNRGRGIDNALIMLKNNKNIAISFQPYGSISQMCLAAN